MMSGTESKNSVDSVGRRSSVKRFVKGSSLIKPANVDGTGLLAILMHPLCVLLVCLPLGWAAGSLGWGSTAIFWLNFFGMIPLAKVLGDATEELAAGLRNDMLAGLLNATFGNAVEVVMMVQTLRAGLTDVVKATLLGSILSNLLLVLGCSFFFGGLSGAAKGKPLERISAGVNSVTMSSSPPNRDGRLSEMEFVAEKVQSFSVMSAMVNTSLLLLSCLTLCLVTVFASESDFEDGDVQVQTTLSISRICAIAMSFSYIAYVFFQLVTHREAMQEAGDGGDDEEEPSLSITMCLVLMFFTTILVAYSTELLVESLDEVVEACKMNTHFIGIILLPIVGNACEHASAIRFAIQDKPGLSIGIAVGSSTQISLFVVPFSVLMGWFMEQSMDLNFGLLNVTVMSMSVVVVLSIIVDGQATWLHGYLLVSAYFVVAVLYWHVPDQIHHNAI